jgi:glycine oxidase
MLAPQMEAQDHDPAFELGLLSRTMYPAWVEEIRALSGLDVGFHVDGALRPATNARELERLAAGVRWQTARGLRVERVDRSAVRSMIPGVRKNVAGGLFFPDEGQVEPRALMRALSLAVAQRGVKLLGGTTVRRLIVEDERIEYVELEDQRISAPRVILAAGAWSALIEGSGISRGAVKPARGQMLALDAGCPPFLPYICTQKGYLVPRRDGRVLVGATVELAGYDKTVTAGGVLELLSQALEIVPSLSGARIVEMWSGLRPWTADQRPILGATPVEGLFLATGHHRNGILQAPATAEIIADLITDRTPNLDLAPFNVTRFGDEVSF